MKRSLTALFIALTLLACKHKEKLPDRPPENYRQLLHPNVKDNRFADSIFCANGADFLLAEALNDSIRVLAGVNDILTSMESWSPDIHKWENNYVRNKRLEIEGNQKIMPEGFTMRYLQDKIGKDSVWLRFYSYKDWQLLERQEFRLPEKVVRKANLIPRAQLAMMRHEVGLGQLSFRDTITFKPATKPNVFSK